MQAQIEDLAQKVVQAYKQTSPEGLLIGIAGPPGSGKSTLAYPLTDRINVLLLNHPVSYPVYTNHDEEVDLASANLGPGQGDEVAVRVGLDGCHLDRADLDVFPDPANAHWWRSIRRSASTTSPPQPTTEDLLPNVRSRRKRRSVDAVDMVSGEQVRNCRFHTPDIVHSIHDPGFLPPADPVKANAAMR